MAPFVVMAMLTGLVAVLIWHFRAVSRPRPTDPAGVRSHVSFVGGERYLAPGESLDEQALGRGMLETIALGLKERGLATGDVIDEDWGALLEVGEGKERLHVCCGYRRDDWAVYVSPRRGPEHALSDSPLLRRLLEAIDATLKSLEGIDRVRWHTTEDWRSGREEQGALRPFGL